MTVREPLHIRKQFKHPRELGDWSEEFARRFMAVDVRPLGDRMSIDCTLYNFDTVQVMQGYFGQIHMVRNVGGSQDSEERLLIAFLDLGTVTFGAHGRQDALRPGEICFVSSQTASTMEIPGLRTRMHVLAVPAKAVRARVRLLDDLNNRVHIVDPVYYNLARRYVSFLFSQYQVPDDAIRMMGQHMIDMICLFLAPNTDTMDVVRHGGLMEMRRETVLKFITDNMNDERLNIRHVSGILGLSERYIRVLLETAGTNFSAHLRLARLQRAASMLQDPRYKTMRISDIAYDVGFTDLSTFNRAFRNQFGDTPKALRSK